MLSNCTANHEDMKPCLAFSRSDEPTTLASSSSDNMVSESPRAIESIELESVGKRSPSMSNLGEEIHEAEEDQSFKPRDKAVIYTSEEEKVVLRKLDRNLVLFLAILYMLSFLDRSSTATASMKQDLAE